MFGKAFITLCGAAVPAAYFMGAFGGGGIDRVVGASPDKVRVALQDLDIRSAPGGPATDPTRSGGVEPTFQLTQEGDEMIWTVMSGKDVAIRMIAHLEPVEGGTRTRVTADVERGNAPDDFVAPAFRSTGVTLGLFSMVLEDELDDLVRPAMVDAAACQKIRDDFINSPPDGAPGFGTTAKTVLRLGALESKLKAAGCDTGFGNFEEVPNNLKVAEGSADVSSRRTTGEVSFEPGKPMVDLSKGR